MGEIDGSAIDTLSAMVLCTLCRDANHGDDTYGSDAAFFEADFHIEIDRAGSAFELQKF